jgi:hypothetical protein
MVDESGTAAFEGSHHGIQQMRMHKQRLTKWGKLVSGKGDYRAPEPDVVTVIAGMVVADSAEVRQGLMRLLEAALF